jgi:cytochrome c oxidase subunit 2
MTATRPGPANLIARAAIMVSLLPAGSAYAAVPQPWQMNFQPAATPVMADIISFHNMLLVLIALIVLLVTALMGYTMWRFNAKRNPVPTRTTHNTLIEVLWTVVPVIILIFVAVPSFRLLYLEDVIPEADMTIKATGQQWYWSYEYPDHGKFGFDANMIPDGEIKPGQVRLLETDNPVVVPVNTTVRVIVTADTVLHAWSVPAFGVKIDAVPGRLNEIWFRADRAGTYYGQCSELCGVNHGFMPIQVVVVSKPAFDAWVGKAKKKFARARGPAPRTLAEAVQSAGSAVLAAGSERP